MTEHTNRAGQDADQDSMRSQIFASLRRHNVSEQCFAEVAAITHSALSQPAATSQSVEPEAIEDAFIAGYNACRNDEGFYTAKDKCLAALAEPASPPPVSEEIEQAYGVLRWIYTNGMQVNRPQAVSDVINEAFASYRIAQAGMPSARPEGADASPPPVGEQVARIISLAKGEPEDRQTSTGAWWWDARYDRARPEYFEGECRDEDRAHADLMIPLLRQALATPSSRTGDAEVRTVLESALRALDSDSLPIVRRAARIQIKHALATPSGRAQGEVDRLAHVIESKTIHLEMRDICQGQAGYRTPGQIADAAWYTGQPSPGATVPAAPPAHDKGEGDHD